MNIKDIYPAYVENQLKLQYGDNYAAIKQAYKEGNIHEYVSDLLNNPAKNYYYESVTDLQIESTVQRFISVFEWNKYKQIYKFDNDLWKLIQDVKALEISSQVFESLPFPVFYIDHDFKNGLYGCMVIFDESDQEKYLELIFLAESNISYLLLPLNENFEGKTIEDIIQSQVSGSYGSDITWYTENIRSVLNAIVYLCTETPDISTRYADIPHVQPKSKRKPKSKKAGISNVGVQIGRIIRESRNNTYSGKSESTGTGSPKAPHMRRAHYHSYWMGSSENKKLVVKFLSPILIHGKDMKENIPTVRIKK